MARFLLRSLVPGLSVALAVAQPAPPPPEPVEGFPTPATQATPGKKKQGPPPAGEGRPPGPRGEGPRGDRGPREPGQRPEGGREDRGPRDDGDRRDRREHFRQKMEGMTAEERARFAENFKRWKQMSDAERDEWKQRMAEERERIEKTIEDAISKAGLQLSQDEKEVFALRYRQERRKIEEELRKEMDGRRTEKLTGMVEKLKAEFGARPGAASTPAPAESTPVEAAPAATPAQP